MRQKLKKIPILKHLYIIFIQIRPSAKIFYRFKMIFQFYRDFLDYKKLENNNEILIDTKDLYPRLDDKTKETKIDPIYFYQNTWCAEKIFENSPEQHVDIASYALFVGIISKFVKTIMVDIRPLNVSIPDLIFKKGSILNLPFEDKSVSSLSSICVIEHIGLGRYGDELDQFGTEKSVAEIERVMRSNGDIYISVPIDEKNKVYFNAHRAFSRDYVLGLFKSCKLVEERYIYGNKIFDNYQKEKGFGTGLYYFKKI